jgi:hypothetical protein
VLKTFLFVIEKRPYKLDCVNLKKPFQPGPTFVSKARASHPL